MDKAENQLSHDLYKTRKVYEPNQHCLHPDLQINDDRIARLLLILSELDECVSGLEMLPQRELTDLVASAVQICGFRTPIEARHAIGTVLSAIEGESSA